jgi:hypothetical protein
VGLIDHLFPFQRSAKVEKTVKSLVDWPTAMQALGVAHEMLYSWLSAAPLGFGLGWTFQLELAATAAVAIASASTNALIKPTRFINTP